MPRWPPLDPALAERLALSDDELVARLLAFAEAVGPRKLDDAACARALGYPWPRPPRSFLLDGDDVLALEVTGAAAGEPRHPLLAIGSNGAPEALTRKLAGLPEGRRRVPVVVGDLHDFDTVAAAHPTLYGSLPATLHPSPGTRLRAAVLWVTTEQLTVLAWTEISYALGRLDGVRFAPDLPGAAPLDSVLAFASRWGAWCPQGEPVALAALPAAGRTLAAHDQEHLLDRLARLVLGEAAGARDLLTLLYADFAGTARRIAPLTRASARPFASPHWTPHPGSPAG